MSLVVDVADIEQVNARVLRQVGPFEATIHAQDNPDKEQAARAEAFARDLDQRVAAGKIDGHEAAHRLRAFDNQEVVAARQQDMRTEREGQLKFSEEREQPQQEKAPGMQQEQNAGSLKFHEDRNPQQDHSHER